METPLKDLLVGGACAFRGYNTTNLGRTPELLAHDVYGPTIEQHLRRASAICSDTLHTQVDLVERVRARRESTLETFGEDIALILAVELAHLDILATHHGVRLESAQILIGYSLGELGALIAGGVMTLEAALPPMVTLAADCAELAKGTTMGVLFSRGNALPVEIVQRMCLELTQQGNGVIAISSFLSPNTILLMGQNETLDRFKALIQEHFGKQVYLRKNDAQWPPLHTPILWQRSIPNRAAVMMQTMAGAMAAPKPPILSLVTGKPSYNELNARELICQWLDRPQRLWDAIYEILSLGIETVVHIGPDPNLIPATFKRLSDNVTAQVGQSTWGQLGLRAAQGFGNRPWLMRMLSARVALMRAPFVRHIVVEDWLLEHRSGT